MSLLASPERVALYLSVGGLLAVGACHLRRSPEDVEKILNDSFRNSRNARFERTTYSHCRAGDGEWDYICEMRSVPTAEGHAKTILDQTTGVKISESCYGPGFDVRPLSQRQTPVPK